MEDLAYFEMAIPIDKKRKSSKAFDGKLPCFNGFVFSPIIELSSGRVVNWVNGVSANISEKVLGDGKYYLLNRKKQRVLEYADSYVPNDYAAHGGDGYGDYVFLDIDSNGNIANYKPPKFNRNEWVEAQTRVVHPLIYPLAKAKHTLIDMPIFKLRQWIYEQSAVMPVEQPIEKIQAPMQQPLIQSPVVNRQVICDEYPPQYKLEAAIPVKSPAMALEFVAGTSPQGEPVCVDFCKTRHVLAAGTTGSGKSVFIHSMLRQLIQKYPPSALKMFLVDPKGSEFPFYKYAKHLIGGIRSDAEQASKALDDVIGIMDERNKLFASRGCRDISRFNSKFPNEKMPLILVVIDEFADIILTDEFGFELKVKRIAAKARSAGIYLFLATQRPDSNVVTGVIKSNIPARICLKVTSAGNSRIILDQAGGEALKGNGDMLVSDGMGLIRRAQGYYVSDDELDAMADILQRDAIKS